MQRRISIAIAGLLFAQLAFALPVFNGMLDDDRPHSAGDTLHGKNLNAGIPEIEDVVLRDDEMLIRIYDAGQRWFKKGGYPADLREIHVIGDAVSMSWYPTCSSEAYTTSTPLDEAWRMLQEMEFFTIKDYRNIPDYPPMADGNFYIIQIKTTDAFREFVFSNPDAHESADNFRFMASLRAIAVFDTPPC